jgi:hypothetical protein
MGGSQSRSGRGGEKNSQPPPTLISLILKTGANAELHKIGIKTIKNYETNCNSFSLEFFAILIFHGSLWLKQSSNMFLSGPYHYLPLSHIIDIRSLLRLFNDAFSTAQLTES